MRVALVQIGVRTDSRSANLTHVLRHIVGAAETEPAAPDLLVLPAGCDGPVSPGLSEAMVQGFAESLAAVAREWGLYVAAGLLEPAGDGFGEAGRLIDPDGDALVRGAVVGEDCVVRKTPLGRVAVGVDVEEAPLAPPAGPCDLMLVHGRWSTPPGSGRQALAAVHDRFSELARRIGAPVCVVGAVGRPDDDLAATLIGGSGLWGPDGHCIASAAYGGEETLHAEVADRPGGRSPQ